MTSSLVGSEMCIRDSAQHDPCALPTGVRHSTPWHPFSNTRILLRQWPVSYTHLTLPTICSV
eukprot:9146652-Prorocentrum_lima.AAC.1